MGLINIIMMKNSNWVQNSVHVLHKKVHSKPIISISIKNNNQFFTSSQDNTIRLWDLRLHSSVKLFRNQELINVTNCQNDRDHLLYIGSGQNVFAFDTRKQGIFVQDIVKHNEDPHFDDVSVIKLDLKENVVAVGDDEGDIRLYNYDLGCTELLDQGHNNIVNAIEFVNTEQGNLCITGGYDCKLIHWRVQDQKIVREIDLQELLKKHQIKATTLPFIHSIYMHKTSLFVTTQSGHVLCFPIKELKKPKYFLQASLARVTQVRIPDFNQNILITLSREGSFSLFDHTKRSNGAPLFLQKYKCHDQPNWMQIMGSQIIISNNLNCELSFFKVK